MRTFERILVAADQNIRAEAPLRFALELAHTMGAELIVFHSISQEEQDERKHLPPPSGYVDVMIEETKRDLAALIADIVDDGEAPATRVVALSGEPAEEIRGLAAAEGCDLIVIGLRRRSRVGKFLLGSNLQDVLMATERPVIAVPTEDEPDTE
jgi:nucleotide-binding universal stress UspA family protein